MTKPTLRKLNCPTCSKEVIWSEDFPFRPFCSKRCKLIDFGDWAGEKHSIPGDPANPEDDEETWG